jgi:hypothetical protein
MAMLLEVARTSETMVNFYQNIQQYNPTTAIFVLTAKRTSNPTMWCSVWYPCDVFGSFLLEFWTNN